MNNISSEHLQKIISRLVEFHTSFTQDNSAQTNISSFIKKNRTFIAKISNGNQERYYSFTTNEDVEKIVNLTVYAGEATASWYYVDESEE